MTIYCNDSRTNDIILTFDSVSFYTELNSEFIINKSNYVEKLFKDLQDDQSDDKYHSHMNIIKMIKDGCMSSKLMMNSMYKNRV